MALEIGPDGPLGDSGVRIGMMFRFKGLEYQRMIIAGVTDGLVPRADVQRRRATDPARHRAETQHARSPFLVESERSRTSGLIQTKSRRTEGMTALPCSRFSSRETVFSFASPIPSQLASDPLPARHPLPNAAEDLIDRTRPGPTSAQYGLWTLLSPLTRPGDDPRPPVFLTGARPCPEDLDRTKTPPGRHPSLTACCGGRSVRGTADVGHIDCGEPVRQLTPPDGHRRIPGHDAGRSFDWSAFSAGSSSSRTGSARPALCDGSSDGSGEPSQEACPPPSWDVIIDADVAKLANHVSGSVSAQPPASFPKNTRGGLETP
ncbi:hypothetical protein [Streptomyces sp. enrichment culture]|uniref:hypothetical protein n=1 Tax=Streptomyces sp. enrichment culture TaxID=1795815 RepID=UPI003F56F141